MCVPKRAALAYWLHLLPPRHPLLGDDLYFEAGGVEAAPDAAFYGKRSTGLFLMSCEVRFPFDGREIHVEVPEARKFARQRERARLGWEHEQAERALGKAIA